MIGQLFGGIFPLLEKALDIRSDRQRVITANIANQDTPRYKAMEIDFNQTLQATTADGSLPLAVSNPSHLNGEASAGLRSAAAAQPPKSLARLDGNTVNAEQEMARLAENSLMYQATVQFISQSFSKLKTAIREGR